MGCNPTQWATNSMAACTKVFSEEGQEPHDTWWIWIWQTSIISLKETCRICTSPRPSQCEAQVIIYPILKAIQCLARWVTLDRVSWWIWDASRDYPCNQWCEVSLRIRDSWASSSPTDLKLSSLSLEISLKAASSRCSWATVPARW